MALETVGGKALTTRRRILAVADDKETLGHLSGLLGVLGVRADQALGTDFLPMGHDGELVVVAALRHPEAYARLYEHFGERQEVVALADETADLASLLERLDLPVCNNVIRREAGWERLLLVTVRKLVTGSVFGLEHYLQDRDAEVHLLRFRSYRGRSAAIDKVVRHARQAGFRRSQRENIAQATEELLMNALYHAPVDEEGRGIFAEVSPKERLGQKSPKPVSVRYCADGERFLVAVRDRYGNLEKEHVLRYLKRCVGEEPQIDTKVSGAGLGIYFVASRAAGLVYNIARGVATEAVVIFQRNRAVAGVPQTIGMFWYDELAATGE